MPSRSCRHALVLLFAIAASACAAPVAVDVCTAETCTEADTICVDGPEGARCDCREGTMRVGGACQVPTECTDATCGGRGTCSVEDGAVRCACEPGFGGPLCERCADGLHDDGAGGCTADPCVPNPCGSDRACVAEGLEPVCECPAGSHDEDGACVPDTECLPTTCGDHGECALDGMTLSCTCDAGFTGRFCDACDLEAGFHDDGMGGCTDDACLPNPCTEPSRGVCTPDGAGGASCSCDPGHHLESDGCVPDEVCTAARCSGHGTCSVVDGRTRCACDPAWAAPDCAACAEGFHDDGAGGCTDDVCLPSPCTTAGRTVCTTGASGAAECACDPGLHEDGVGGCTADPCVPDPCAALGQACRDAGGVAECFTPVCTDGNPCTLDEVIGGGCRFTPLADGTACSTTLCTSGQTCSAGTCGGGAAVSCDDGNDCTVDSCDAIGGCVRVNDDTIVPADGLACTVDRCLGGIAMHTPSDPVCDDGLWCTGTERCLPAAAGADARGCVAQALPVAPAAPTTCGRYECSDAMMRFDFVATSGGTSCDDAITCTTGDACDGTGACRGTVTGDCGACAGAGWSGGVDVAPARIRGRILYAGSTTFPSAADPASVSLYLRSQSTGTLSRLEAVSFSPTADGSGRYPVRSLSAADDRVIDLPILPGIYDVIHRRWSSMPTTGVITSHSPTDAYAHADHALITGLVIGPGLNVVDVDVSPTRVSGALRYEGGTTFPTAADPASVSLYLRSRSTGTLSRFEAVSFTPTADGSGRYPVRSLSAADDRVIDLPILPGRYDVVYRRWSSMPTTGVITSHSPADAYAHADQVLVEDVVIGGATATLDVEVAPVRVSGVLRYEGSTTFPSAADPASVSLYLRSRSTGTITRFEAVSFTPTADGSGRYPVRSLSAADDRVIDLPILPGTYDVIYRRWSSMPTTGVITSHSPADAYAHADHALREDVTIGPGATALDLDVAPVRVSGALRYEGATTFPSAADPASASLYLRSRSTGTISRFEAVSFTPTADGGGRYPVRSLSAADDRVIDLPILPGRYDVIYRRWSSMPTTGVITSHSPADAYAHADHALREDVAIGPGATMLDVEVAPVRLSGAIRYEGGATFPTAADPASASLYLRSRSTGTIARLEAVSFTPTADGSGRYAVRSLSAADDRVIDLPILPGSYDVIYRRWSSMPSTGVITSHSPSDAYAHADHAIVTALAIGPGATSLYPEIAPIRVGGALRYAGGAVFPTAADPASVSLYLRSRSTGTISRFEAVSFTPTADASGRYPVRSLSTADDRVIDLPILAGDYDVVHRRWSSMPSTGVITSHAPTDDYAHADHHLAACIAVE